jgi:hypothetical protein
LLQLQHYAFVQDAGAFQYHQAYHVFLGHLDDDLFYHALGVLGHLPSQRTRIDLKTQDVAVGDQFYFDWLHGSQRTQIGLKAQDVAVDGQF